MRLIYKSRILSSDPLALTDILLLSRENNARDDITGCLLRRGRNYVQLLEGPAEEVTACFGRIGRDDRHDDIEVLLHDDTDARLFTDWSMFDARAHDTGQAALDGPDALNVFAGLDAIAARE